MSVNKNQSAIQECRDQLFLDTADGVRLNVVTGNLGLNRPPAGFTDDEWRAAAKEIALQYKQVRTAFHRTLDVCQGPQKTRLAVLNTAAVVGATILDAADSSDLVQLGTLILDPGLATEESVKFCFRDIGSGKIYLVGSTAFAHEPVVYAAGRLVRNVPIGSTILPMDTTANHPTTGFPYSLILGRGTPNEEVVAVTANDTFRNELTVGATTIFHAGPTTLLTTKTLADDTFTGRTFIILGLRETRNLPATGFLRFSLGTAATGILTFTGNVSNGDQVTTGTKTYTFETVLTNVDGNVLIGAIAGDSIDNLIAAINREAGSGTTYAAATTGNDFVSATTTVTPGEMQVFALITGTDGNSIIIDDPVDGGGVMSWTGATLVGGTGGASEVREYTSNDASDNILRLRRPLQNDYVATTPVNLMAGGEWAETASIIQQGTGWEIFETEERKIKVYVPASEAGQRLYDASFLHESVQAPAGSTTLSAGVAIGDTVLPIVSATDFPDEAGVILINGTDFAFYIFRDETVPELTLTSPLTSAFSPGDTVVLQTFPYGGAPDLEDGNWRDLFGDVQFNQFPGPYVYGVFARAPSSTKTTLLTPIPKTTRIAAASTTQKCLEVVDVGLWPGPPQRVRIGRGTGFVEDQDIVDLTLRDAAGSSTTVAFASLVSAQVLIGVDTSGFPESNGVNIAGYRIRIDAGGGNDETIVINQNNVGTDTFSTFTPMVSPHNPGETIEILNDILTIDTPLTETHTTSQFADILFSEIDIASGTGFPTNGGNAILNFGKETINRDVLITGVISPAVLEFTSTDEFPATASTPYQVVVGVGTPQEEIGIVTLNDTGLDRLTFTPALVNTHVAGEHVVFDAPDPEEIVYDFRTGTTLSFPEQVLDSDHLVGETVMYSASQSNPSIEGTDFAFLMPSAGAACVAFLFEFIRAAGIEVEFVEDL